MVFWARKRQLFVLGLLIMCVVLRAQGDLELDRPLIEDDEIGPYRVMAGDMVAIAPMLTHMYPDVWPNPEAFEPERFAEERSRGRHPNAYYPFHAGERFHCVVHGMDAQIVPDRC